MDNARALERIEQAERETRLCSCGRTPLAIGRSDGVWLECPSLGEARSTLSRILTFDFAAGHTRWRIIDSVDLDPELVQAA